MLTEQPLKPNDLFAYLKKSFILIDLKLQGLLILHSFKILIDIFVLAGFAVVDKLKYCAACVGFFVVFDLSEKLSACLSHEGDVLIFRASIFVNDICIKSFWAFAFVVKILGYFSAGVCGFDFYVVLLKNCICMFLEL